MDAQVQGAALNRAQGHRSVERQGEGLLSVARRCTASASSSPRRHCLDRRKASTSTARAAAKYGHVAEFFTVEQLLDIREIYAGRIPPNMLAIGDDPGGNLLLLSVSGEDAGRVCFWAHECEHEPPTYKNVYRIADGFQAFLKSIREAEEDDA